MQATTSNVTQRTQRKESTERNEMTK